MKSKLAFNEAHKHIDREIYGCHRISSVCVCVCVIEGSVERRANLHSNLFDRARIAENFKNRKIENYFQIE